MNLKLLLLFLTSIIYAECVHRRPRYRDIARKGDKDGFVLKYAVTPDKSDSQNSAQFDNDSEHSDEDDVVDKKSNVADIVTEEDDHIDEDVIDNTSSADALTGTDDHQDDTDSGGLQDDHQDDADSGGLQDDHQDKTDSDGLQDLPNDTEDNSKPLDQDNSSYDKLNQDESSGDYQVDTDDSTQQGGDESDLHSEDSDYDPTNNNDDPSQKDSKCWSISNLKSTVQKQFKIYKNAQDTSFSVEGMIEDFVKSRGVAQNAIHEAGGRPEAVPAGFNLGDHTMVLLNNSLLFFHRMKLRNDTNFVINNFRFDKRYNKITSIVSLNDLHLTGEYERAIVDPEGSKLYYKPTFGSADLLLRNVTYYVNAHYRQEEDCLQIDMVVSKVTIKEALLSYANENGTIGEPKKIQVPDKGYFAPNNLHSSKSDNDEAITSLTLIQSYADSIKPQPVFNRAISRIQANLDDWFKDYFNDYLHYNKKQVPEVTPEDTQRDTASLLLLNDFIDSALRKMKRRQQKLQISSIILPPIHILTATGLELKLTDGVVHGLDSMYRRSATTSSLHSRDMNIDTVIGFSDIRATYKYEAVPAPNHPRLGGLIVLTVEDPTAHLQIIAPDQSPSNITFQYLRNLKPLAMTVEGAASRVINNFKHLLEVHVKTLLYNAVIDNIEKLHTLTRCVPHYVSYTTLGDFDNPVSADSSGDGNNV